MSFLNHSASYLVAFGESHEVRAFDGLHREHERLFVRPLERHLLTDGEGLIAPLLQQLLRHLVRVEKLLRRRFL